LQIFAWAGLKLKVRFLSVFAFSLSLSLSLSLPLSLSLYLSIYLSIYIYIDSLQEAQSLNSFTKEKKGAGM
jgi:hypothetical protein